MDDDTGNDYSCSNDDYGTSSYNNDSSSFCYNRDPTPPPSRQSPPLRYPTPPPRNLTPPPREPTPPTSPYERITETVVLDKVKDSGIEYTEGLRNSFFDKEQTEGYNSDEKLNNENNFAQPFEETAFCDDEVARGVEEIDIEDGVVRSSPRHKAYNGYYKNAPKKSDTFEDSVKPDLFSAKMKLSMVDKITVFLGELISTGLLVFLGCMGCIKSDTFPNNHLQMTLNFGLVILILVQCFGCVTGAHMNPAVTLAAVVYKLVTPIVGCIYVVGQFLGAFIGYGLLKALVPGNTIKMPGAEHGLCVTTPSSEISSLQGLGIEFVLTTVLILLCCGVWDPRNAKHQDSVAIKFGLAISSLAITGGQFTGASMNPARSFAPALWNADFQDHWIYWVGPMAAALVASIAYKAVFWRQEPLEKDPKLRAMEELPLR